MEIWCRRKGEKSCNAPHRGGDLCRCCRRIKFNVDIGGHWVLKKCFIIIVMFHILEGGIDWKIEYKLFWKNEFGSLQSSPFQVPLDKKPCDNILITASHQRWDLSGKPGTAILTNNSRICLHLRRDFQKIQVIWATCSWVMFFFSVKGQNERAH